MANTIDVDLTNTMFGPTFCVVDGVDALMSFLVRGDRERLDRARERFTMAVMAPEGRWDRDARWVAAHLRFLADEMNAGSLWTLLPPETPGVAKQAFTLTGPPVLALWQPQRELLTNITDPNIPAESTESEAGQSALDPSVRRLVLSVPTSSGKTLAAQLLMVSHLATTSTGVCYITPLRSLGREVRRSLGRRLRVIAKEVSREEPDFGLSEEMAMTLNEIGGDSMIRTAADEAEQPDVAVMTPERLAFALHEDPRAVLDRFGLFVFDEAQLIREPSRGFLIESMLAFLHWRTHETNHRIVLLSAAMGNAGELVGWLKVESGAYLLKSEWRGPRRLHAIFSTEIDWQNPTSETVAARGGQAHLTRRLTYPTYGVVRLRPAEHQPVQVRTTAAIGAISFRATANGIRERHREQSHSTPFYKMLSDIAAYVSHAGPVLVIRSTRREAVSMAEAIAARMPDRPSSYHLAELARSRLGSEHQLVSFLRKGVAYHHAGLPAELQEAIEDGIRDDSLRFVVATSTLTEGVNLPVRTVVLAAIPYEGQPHEQQLVGGRLINAMGRAGRATRESEGWIILARPAEPQPADFDLLEPDEADLEVRSRLADESALEALALFEDAVRAGEDAIVAANGVIADFVSYVWFVLAAEEELGRVGNAAEPMSAFAATLAYAQLDVETRQRFEQLINVTHDAYAACSPERRRRWAKVGSSIASARMLDELVEEIVAAVTAMPSADADTLVDPFSALDFLEQLHAFDRILQLREIPRPWVFHETESAQSPLVELRPVELLQHWLRGETLPEMADSLLSGILDRSLRIERLVDAISDFCEHYFSWTVRALLGQANIRLSEPEEGEEHLVCPELPAFIHYGVASPEAVGLLTSGIRSRDLANGISREAAGQQIGAAGLRDWLGRMALPGWRSGLDATPADLLDLLEYCRTPGSNELRRLLADGIVTIPVNLIERPRPHEESFDVEKRESSDHIVEARIDGRTQDHGLPVFVHPIVGLGLPAPLGVFFPDSMEPAAIIPASLHTEAQAILDTGLDIDYFLDGRHLTARLVERQ
jgi:hypothetical protein